VQRRWSQAPHSGAQRQDQRQCAQAETQKVLLEHQETLFFTVRVTKHWDRLPEKLWSLHPWRQSKANWTSSWAACSRWPCLSRELDQLNSRGPFQPQPFCDEKKKEKRKKLPCKWCQVSWSPLALQETKSWCFKTAAGSANTTTDSLCLPGVRSRQAQAGESPGGTSEGGPDPSSFPSSGGITLWRRHRSCLGFPGKGRAVPTLPFPLSEGSFHVSSGDSFPAAVWHSAWHWWRERVRVNTEVMETSSAFRGALKQPPGAPRAPLNANQRQ